MRPWSDERPNATRDLGGDRCIVVVCAAAWKKDPLANAPLDTGDIGAMHACAVGEVFLRDALSLPQPLHVEPH
jgi:hypothetical protein